ncbi:DMT family transporter [Nitrincola iocasae]|uniref:DMT family transporter n=1 Tax=Nitrincola iocasae TaxID=2614693 RepID=A0A5J6LJA3_9GAMM|nr:DMT family transporter [Nitrincola iocasae]QEW08191.1 DMT family transporter [Nitrincola iocasae]
MLIRFVPLIFVLLWSTGFIGARYALPWIEPFNLLFIRMVITLAVFLLLILVLRARWPGPRQAGHQMVVGLLIHGVYLGGVFAAIKLALPAGVTALVVGLQPLLTALLAWVGMGQQLRRIQWLGLVAGLLGVSLVLSSGLMAQSFVVHPLALVAVLLSLLSISIGTLYQKKFGGQTDLLTGSFYQYLATALCMAVLAYSFETREVIWHPDLILALLWLVFGLSVSAILLLMLMIRLGEVSRVASYFYLVPPLTAIEAWWLFDEQLSGVALLGILITVTGVYLALKKPAVKSNSGVE